MTGLARLARPALALAALLAIGACKQGEGDRCETTDDCASGLVCNGSLRICQSEIQGDANVIPPPDANSGEVPDAEAPADASVDAAIDDAAIVDAAVDATVDATVDANGT
jgi:hypothetical protein